MFQGGEYTPKPKDTLWISSHNYCGITTSNYYQCLLDLEHLQIDLQGFAETNLNTNRIDVRQKLSTITKRHTQHCCSVCSTTDTDSVTDYKPGGTGLLATNTLVSRIKHQGRDNKEILIIMIYQCCNHPTNLTWNSAFSQQQILLSEMNRPSISPRINLFHDLCKLIQDCQHQNPNWRVPVLGGSQNDKFFNPVCVSSLCTSQTKKIRSTDKILAVGFFCL